MQTLDMAFFEEFKKLENICNDLFSCKSGVTEYITRMEQAAEKGRVAVPGWDADYKTLKHLRWLRNQIAHSAEDGVFCKQEDLNQLRKFHKRVMAQEDPLTMLSKAAKPKAAAKAKPKQGKDSRKPSAGKPGTAVRRDSGKQETPKKQSRAGAIVLLIFVVMLLLVGLGVLYLDVSGRLPLSELGDTIRSLPGKIHG